jgi:site-specific DNA-methyltransferase (adenine-specific)
LKADADGRSIETIVDGKCKFCGISQKDYDRDSGLESHAYAFIHQEQTREFVSSIFGANVKFDVIIGNPPYQLSTEGHGVQAKPIYNLFVEQAKSLDPRFLCMVIPARWFSGGMGLSDFRQSMLNDSSLRVIEDFPDSSEVFPGTQIKGGVCYFLWDRDSKGDVRVTTHDKGVAISTAIRPLLEPGADVFIRFNEAIPILKKVMSVEKGLKNPEFTLGDELSFASLVSSIGAFGLDSTFRGKTEPSRGDLKVYRNGGVGYVDRESITKERSAIDKWKVFIPRAGSGSDSFPHSILGKPFVGEPGAISSWTYMHIGPFESEREAQNVISYISTKVFRFLVLLHKPTQDATRAVYTYVPKLDFSKAWTAAELRARYGLTESEMEFIDSLIRPMGEADD